MPIKTLHLTNAYHSASGGISTTYRALLHAANEQHRYLRLVVPAERTRVEDVGEYGRIYHIRAPRVPLFDSRYRILLPYKYLLPSISPIRRILREERPDLIEVCDKYALIPLAGLIRRGLLSEIKRPTLVAMSCERMDANIQTYITRRVAATRFARFWIGNIYLPLFDYHIANSPYTAEELTSAIDGDNCGRWQWLFEQIWRFWKTPEMPTDERISVSTKGVDARHFTPQRRSATVRQELLRMTNARSDRAGLLLYAGRLSPEKNIKLLIDMMDRLIVEGDREYHLLIAGDGPLRTWLERQREDFETKHGKICVHLLGHIGDREQLADLYANTDAFVHPNPQEPFGIAPLEAFASGVPLVAANSGGILTYADHTNAWLAEPHGASFAAAVRSVFDDSQERQIRLERARRVAEANCWSQVAARFLSLYDELHARFASDAGARAVIADAGGQKVGTNTNLSRLRRTVRPNEAE